MFKSLSTIEEWNQLLELSKSEPVVVLKHSNSCPVSATAHREVDNYDGDVYVVIVQTARDVSNQIAEDLGVVHQSPQLIVIKDGKSVDDTSHISISSNKIKQVVDNNR